MSDDLTTRLRVLYCALDGLTPCGTCLTCQAADEIERLRAAGDQLAYHVRAENAKDMYTAVRLWEQARREQ